MIFAALSTELAVFENILACVREITGWNRVKGSVICGIGMFLLSLTTALGFTALSGFQPFAKGSSFLDFWDFIVSTNLLPLGSITFAIFCCSKRYGWGWDNFVQEANFRQRPEGKELDEANMPVCSAHRRGGDIHLRPCNLCLEVRNMSALLTFPFAVV